MKNDRIAAAAMARSKRTDDMLERVRRVLADMKRDHVKVTAADVARRAEVSRTFLYQNADAQRLLQDGAAAARAYRAQAHAEHAAHVEASWRERALNTEHALTTAHNEIAGQRSTIAQLLGRIRDLESDLPDGDIQRTLTENTTLKHELRQLKQETRRLEERLHAARENNRFLDHRIAGLEAELTDQHNPAATELTTQATS